MKKISHSVKPNLKTEVNNKQTLWQAIPDTAQDKFSGGLTVALVLLF